MVNKGDKPVQTTLARGEVLPSELRDALRQAAADAKFVFVYLAWRDGHTASVTDVGDLEPIEDAGQVFSVYARFDYEDDSQLTMELRNSRTPSITSAKGPTARARQAAIGQAWATIPGRARLTMKWDVLLWAGSFGLMAGQALQVVVTAVLVAMSLGGVSALREYQAEAPGALGWALRIAGLLLSIALFLFVRRLTQHRLRARLVVLHRPESRLMEVWTVIAGVAGVGALVWGVVAYLFPRN
jgi:hypothetical protein